MLKGQVVVVGSERRLVRIDVGRVAIGSGSVSGGGSAW